MKVLVILLIAATAVLAKHEAYQGWKSYFVGPAPSEKLKIFNSILHDYDVDILSYPLVQREGVILVSPEKQEPIIKKLKELEISYRIHRDDVKRLSTPEPPTQLRLTVVSDDAGGRTCTRRLSTPEPPTQLRLTVVSDDAGGRTCTRRALDYDDEKIAEKHMETVSRNGGKSLPYDNYQELDVIYDYIDDIAKRYPETVTLVEPALSFENRKIKYLKISTTNFEDESKPIIFIDGGIHSREWISPPTVTWAIHKLVEDVTEPDLLERFDWILLPMVNPDGYVQTFTANGRWWRKTRSTDQHALGYLYPGVDGNRNYDFHWNEVGTSNLPWSDIFAGSHPFSEIETRVVRDILHDNLHRIGLYLTMHSYGSMILYPWGHDGSLPNNALALHVVGVEMAEAINAERLPHFPNYVVGNSALVLNYAASGASEDYAHSIGVPLTYTYELPGLAGSFEGFNLNPRYIQQVCIETWSGIVAGARSAGDLLETSKRV